MAWEVEPARSVASFILDRLFEGDAPAPPRPDAAGRSFPLAGYQEVAVRRARRVLEERGGVLVADDVGLGKTFVALALVEEAIREAGDVLVTFPAALRTIWEPALRRLTRRTDGCARIHTATHTGLARRVPDPGPRGFSLVVVDEAHRFRNPDTRRYTALARACARASGSGSGSGSGRMVLLTATPVNNSVTDLLHLLRLFAADDAFRDIGVASLTAAFETAAARSSADAEGADGGPGHRPEELGRVVDAVMVRRTRAAVRRDCRCDGGDPRTASGKSLADLTFPDRTPPGIVRYDDPDLEHAAGMIETLELACYETLSTRGGGVALVRAALLKRLDSSRAALRSSVAAQVRFGRAVIHAAAGGALLHPRDLRWPSSGDADPNQLVLVEMVAERAPPHVDLEALTRSTLRDVRRLLVVAKLTGEAGCRDPKLEALVDLCRRLAFEKVLVFTEYRDTAEALWRALVPVVATARIDGEGAWLGDRPAGRAAVVQRFAPLANGGRPPLERERVDVLVATDVLAEGLNLQDARHVVCYDLPWNPVRLLQRIGRVDRLGSPHRDVASHLFVPAYGVDRVIGLTRILGAKFGDIIGVVGADRPDRLLARILAGGEEAGRALDRAERQRAPPMERLRQLWSPVEQPALGTPPRSGLIPLGLVPLAGSVVVLAEHDGRPHLLEWDPKRGTLRTAGEAAVRMIRTALEGANSVGAALPRSPPAGDPRQVPRPLATGLQRAVSGHFRALEAMRRAPVAVDRRTSQARLQRLLTAALDRQRALPSEVVARVESLLERLARPLRPPEERRVRQVVRDWTEGMPLPRLLEGLERVLPAPADAGADPPRRPASRPRIVAVLLPEEEEFELDEGGVRAG